MMNILKVYAIFLFIGLALSIDSIHSLNLSFHDFQNNNMDINEKDNNILRPMIMSALIPGLGQYMQGDEIRSGVYLGIELSGLYANRYYNNEGDQEVIQYKNFSEQYWTFEDWIVNYDCWNPSENGDCDYNYSYLFSSINPDTGEETYIPIWQSSHHINFYINHPEYSGLISTNDDAFINLYYLFIESGLVEEFVDGNGSGEYDEGEEFTDSNDNNIWDEGFISEYGIEVIKDHHFYEGIRKYNMFFSGWNDSISDIEELDQPSGYAVATSPNKKRYNSTWNKSIELYDYAQYAVTAIYLNHVISVLDIYFKNKFDNKFNIEVKNNYQSQSANYFLKLSIKL